MDNSHVALVSMILKAESFSPFRCDRNLALGINLTSLTKVLRAAQNEDILTLKAEDAPDVVNLVFENSETDRLSEYDIKLMDIDQEHLGIPDTEYAATVEMPSAEFQRISRDLGALSESGKEIQITLATNIVGQKMLYLAYIFRQSPSRPLKTGCGFPAKGTLAAAASPFDSTATSRSPTTTSRSSYLNQSL